MQPSSDDSGKLAAECEPQPASLAAVQCRVFELYKFSEKLFDAFGGNADTGIFDFNAHAMRHLRYMKRNTAALSKLDRVGEQVDKNLV